MVMAEKNQIFGEKISFARKTSTFFGALKKNSIFFLNGNKY